MKGRHHILIVDDHPDNRLLLQASLEPCGYQVSVLGDGEASLAAILERPNEFDLILLDLKLPGLSGLEVLARLRRIHSRLDLPVIVVTALGNDDHMVNALQAGANDYITKPVHLGPLTERVRTQLELVASRRALAGEVEERRRAQTRFEAMAESLRVATRSAGIGLWEWSPESGRFVWDAPLCHLYGLNPARAKPSRETWRRIVHPEDLSQFERKLEAALAGEENFDTTFRIIRPDGEIRHLEGHASVYRSAHHGVTKATGANWDVTARRQAREATLEAAERERNRIGRDLHDGLCQELGGIGLLSAAMEERMRQKGLSEMQNAATISEQLILATERARALAHGLSPLAAEGQSLSEALESLANRHRQTLPSLEVSLTLDLDCATLPAAHATELYFIASEAFANAVRHGHPETVGIELRGEGDDIVLAVSDDGCGCADQLDRSKGIGLGSMQHRAWTLGGVITLANRPAGGRNPGRVPPSQTIMSKQSSATRIFLIDDHPLVRMGLAQILSTQQDLVICGEIGQGRGAVEAAMTAAPDLIILDLSLPDTGGLELIKSIRSAGLTGPILVNSMHPETLYAERALRAGADGYLMKQVAPKLVLSAVRKVLAGEVYLSEEMTRQLVNRMAGAHRPGRTQSVENLSDREFEVFEHIGRGRSSPEIGTLLGISPRTVDVHRGNIKAKLGLSSSAELARVAVSWVESNAAQV